MFTSLDISLWLIDDYSGHIDKRYALADGKSVDLAGMLGMLDKDFVDADSYFSLFAVQFGKFAKYF